MDKLKEITGRELLEAILKETGDEYRDTMVSKYSALLSAFAEHAASWFKNISFTPDDYLQIFSEESGARPSSRHFKFSVETLQRFEENDRLLRSISPRPVTPNSKCSDWSSSSNSDGDSSDVGTERSDSRDCVRALTFFCSPSASDADSKHW